MAVRQGNLFITGCDGSADATWPLLLPRPPSVAPFAARSEM
jgi:hypothetical protein